MAHQHIPGEVEQIAPGGIAPKWTIRRTMIIVLLMWCGILITYLSVWGQSDALREAIATSVLLLMGMIVSTYLLGVVWSDMSFMKYGGSGRAGGYGGYGGYGGDPYMDQDPYGPFSYRERRAGYTDRPPAPIEGQMGD